MKIEQHIIELGRNLHEIVSNIYGECSQIQKKIIFLVNTHTNNNNNKSINHEVK